MLSLRRQKEIASLSQRKYRRRLGQTVVEGVRAVEGAEAAGASILELIVTDDGRSDAVVSRIVTQTGHPVHTVDARTMQRLTGVSTPPGILAVVEIRTATLEQVIACDRILALDAVGDPGNLGALVRTAAWFGIKAIVMGSGCADPFSPKVVRSTMSALWDVHIVEASDLAGSLEELRRNGATVVGATLDGVDARSWKSEDKTALVLGNEAHGISRDVLSQIDERVTIPASGNPEAMDSLNVATAGAILMYQWTR